MHVVRKRPEYRRYAGAGNWHFQNLDNQPIIDVSYCRAIVRVARRPSVLLRKCKLPPCCSAMVEATVSPIPKPSI